MKAILETVGQTLAMLIKGFIEIITLPCEVLNINDYWAIAYTSVIVGLPLLFRRRKK